MSLFSVYQFQFFAITSTPISIYQFLYTTHYPLSLLVVSISYFNTLCLPSPSYHHHLSTSTCFFLTASLIICYPNLIVFTYFSYSHLPNSFFTVPSISISIPSISSCRFCFLLQHLMFPISFYPFQFFLPYHHHLSTSTHFFLTVSFIICYLTFTVSTSFYINKSYIVLILTHHFYFHYITILFILFLNIFHHLLPVFILSQLPLFPFHLYFDSPLIVS